MRKRGCHQDTHISPLLHSSPAFLMLILTKDRLKSSRINVYSTHTVWLHIHCISRQILYLYNITANCIKGLIFENFPSYINILQNCRDKSHQMIHRYKFAAATVSIFLQEKGRKNRTWLAGDRTILLNVSKAKEPIVDFGKKQRKELRLP